MPGPLFLAGDGATRGAATGAGDDTPTDATDGAPTDAGVTLHLPADEDVPFLLDNWNDPAVRATRTDVYPRGPDEIRRYVGGRLGREDRSLALLACADGEPVGLVMLVRERPGDVEFRRGELAFWIAPDRWGDGHATAGAGLLLAHAFDRLDLRRVRASAYADNGASRRVLEKLGFAAEGTDREAAVAGGDRVDVVRYGLLADEWRG